MRGDGGAGGVLGSSRVVVGVWRLGWLVHMCIRAFWELLAVTFLDLSILVLIYVTVDCCLTPALSNTSMRCPGLSRGLQLNLQLPVFSFVR